MVSEKTVNNKVIFLCDICGLGYADKKTAKDCEDYCKTNPGSCSPEITDKAVFFPDMAIELAKKK